MAAGDLPVINTPQDGTKATYSAAGVITMASGPTDVMQLVGSSTKTVRILRAVVTVLSTSSTGVQCYAPIYSTASTGGTKTTATAVPHDSNSAAATATVNKFTANPTVGSIVGYARIEQMLTFTSTALGSRVEWLAGNFCGQALVLRGTSQYFAVNFAGQTISGGSLACYLEWTEE